MVHLGGLLLNLYNFFFTRDILALMMSPVALHLDIHNTEFLPKIYYSNVLPLKLESNLADQRKKPLLSTTNVVQNTLAKKKFLLLYTI